jgi:hypothetical protein
MPISNSYPRGIPIEDQDLFVGTKAANNRTVNYTAQGVADYLNINSKVAIGGQMSFQFTIVPNIPKTIAFEGGGGSNTAFSAITKLIVSAIDLSTANITIFLNYLNNSQVLLSQQNQPNFVGHYKITGYTQIGTSAFYELDLEFIGGNGTIGDNQYYDLVSFVLSTEVPATEWGSITGDIEDQTDLINYISSQITTPSLQQVTTVGNTTTDTITVAGIYSGNLYSDGYDFGISDNMDNSYNMLYQPFVGLQIANAYTSDYIYLYQDASIGFQTAAGDGNLRSDLLTNTRSWQFPDASGTLALLSDIPTLQEVLDNNHDLVDDNNFQGTGAGDGNTGYQVNAFGFNAANDNSGIQVNALGTEAAIQNSGLSVNALGTTAAASNTGDNVNALGVNSAVNNTAGNVNALGEEAGINNIFENVNLFGFQATADLDNQTVFSKRISGVDKYLGRLSFNNITTDRKWELQDADGTIALTSDIQSVGFEQNFLLMGS